MHLKSAKRTFIFKHKDTDDIMEITNHQSSIYNAIDAAKASMANADERLSNYTLEDAIMINGINKKESILDKTKSVMNIEVS